MEANDRLSSVAGATLFLRFRCWDLASTFQALGSLAKIPFMLPETENKKGFNGDNSLQFGS